MDNDGDVQLVDWEYIGFSHLNICIVGELFIKMYGPHM